jgi:hypothetical protein
MNLLTVFNSIMATRGATYNVNTSELNPSTGYMVAQKGFEKVVELDGELGLNQFQYEVRNYWTKDVWDQLYNRTDIYMGFWVNQGKLYIDLVERIENRETAIAEGLRNNQIAIWDAFLQKNIHLQPTSYYSDKSVNNKYRPTLQVSNDPDIETDKKY